MTTRKTTDVHGLTTYENYVAKAVETARGIIAISDLTDAELAHHARVAWNVNDGDTLRGCRAEATKRGIQVA